MDWLDKRELHAGIALRSSVTRAPSVVSSTASLVGGAIKQQRQRLVELQERRADLARKRKERESYLLYLRSLFAASSGPSTRPSTTAASNRSVVHVALGETWDIMELKEKEIEKSLRQLAHK